MCKYLGLSIAVLFVAAFTMSIKAIPDIHDDCYATFDIIYGGELPAFFPECNPDSDDCTTYCREYEWYDDGTYREISCGCYGDDFANCHAYITILKSTGQLSSDDCEGDSSCIPDVCKKIVAPAATLEGNPLCECVPGGLGS